MKVANTPSPFLAVGAFPADAAAHRAVQHLRAAGNPDAAISVARQVAASSPPPEMPTMARVFWSGFWWSVVGAGLGAALGLVVGVLDLGVLGALLGCYLVLDTGDKFSRKADHHDTAATLVRVQASDAEAAARAEHIMREAGASSVDNMSVQP